MTEQILNDNMQYYLDIWKEMLGELLGWPESRVMDWVRQTGKLGYLQNRDDIFFHETPQYWAKGLLVPDSLKARLSAIELIQLESRILAAFKDEHHYSFPRGTNWQPYRARVEQILSDYGEHLPRAAREPLPR